MVVEIKLPIYMMEMVATDLYGGGGDKEKEAVF